MTNTPKKKIIKSITGLKIICVLLIILWHSNREPWYPDLGARCCELLFICSGFCMGYNYISKKIDSGIINTIKFTWKRIKKVYILYAFTTFVALGFLIFFKHYHPGEVDLVKLSLNLTFLQPWTNAGTFNGAAWFLAVLIFCYFCTPAIIQLIQYCKDKKKLILLFSIILIVRIALELIATKYPNIISISVHTRPTVRVLEYAMACILGSWFFWQCNDSQKNHVLVDVSFVQASIIELICTISYIYMVFQFNGVFYRIAYVIFGLILVYILSFEKGVISKILSIKPLAFLAQYELEIFLFHQVVINSILLHHAPSLKVTALSFMITLVIGIIWHKTYSGLLKLFMSKQGAHIHE